jgi:hypothetical protein
MNESDLNLLLARLPSTSLPTTEIAAIREELAADPSALDALTSLLEINGLESAGTLPELSRQEASVVLQHLHAIAQDIHIADAEGSALGDSADDSSENAVRNDDDAVSLMGGKENTDMIPLNTQRQQSIDSVFGRQPVDVAPEHVGNPGAPELFSLDVKQELMDNCAIKGQQLILEEFGIEVSSDELIRMAYINGWYMPGGGTLMDDVGKLLEAHGIEVNRYENANIFNLVSELAQGRQIIIAVDSSELWASNDVLRDLAMTQPNIFGGGIDHAVIVSGVDISDPNNPVVIITDPGTGQVGATYPLEDFLKAWENSGFWMVSTAVSPEQFVAANVDAIGEIPYDTFAQWYPNLCDLTGTEEFFPKLCEIFRFHLHNPLTRAVSDLFELLPGFDSPSSTDIAGGLLGSGMDDGIMPTDAPDADDDDDAWC